MIQRLSLAPCAILLVWLLFFFFQTGSKIISAYNPLPEVDYWEIVPHLDGYLHFPPAVLWEQHNEHRVVFPEIVFAIDWIFLKGREVLPLILIAVLDVGLWVIFLIVVRDQARLAHRGIGPVGWCALFLAGIVMFWPGVTLVLAFPFSLQWLLYQFGATASLLALSYRRVNLAIALAVIATFSSANGLVVWPVLLLFGSLIPLGWKRLLGIAGAWAASTALFFVDYHNRGNFHPGVMFLHPAKYFGYFFSYLGMPFGIENLPGGLAAGVASVVLAIFLAVLAWRRKQAAQPISIVCLGIWLLTLLTVFVTASSRIPMDRPFEQAVITPVRYVNFAVHYWAALAVLLVWTAGQIRPTFAWAAVFAATVFFGATLFRTGHWLNDWMGQFTGYQYATLAVESGLMSDEIAHSLNYSDITLPKRSVSELKRRHLALFSSDEYQLVGKPFASLSGRARFEVPAANITAVQAIDGGFRIVGWAKPHVRQLVVVDGDRTIIGLGRHLTAGVPIGVPPPTGHAEDFWLAIAGPSFHREQARFFVLL